ncbi:MAG: HAD-IIIC family phosphatase [Acidobacteria bacterium]|nr:HAD-IIIC family phosphatase [Acidobacteriota bacterium]
MSRERTPLVVLADFNAANLASLLTRDAGSPVIDARSAGPSAAAWTEAQDEAHADVAVVWTRPERVSPAYDALLTRGDGRLTDILHDVDAFGGELKRLRDRSGRLIVMSWSLPPLGRAFGALALSPRGGAAHALLHMNLRLSELVAALPGVVLLDSSRWMPAERRPDEAKLWYAAKIPFGTDVFRRAVLDVKGALQASVGQVRKVIVLDLDDTLWGGIVGDVGWAGLRLGGHDAVGEAYCDFQRALLAFAARGVMLAVVSKNEEATALEAIDRHPEMILRQRDLAGWRINWDDKAANVAVLARQLNVGLDAMVFIDDNPAERGRVREALPDVLVPEWPASPLLYVDALLGLTCFNSVAVTDEDRERTRAYVAERDRERERDAAGSVEDWLARLDLSVHVERLSPRTLPRAAQLLNKTNQMNLSTRRLDAAALETWAADPARAFWTFRAMDRFGDAGLTGLASVEIDGPRAEIVDFVLSCRVFGRHIEDVMLHIVADAARQRGATTLGATFVPTAKNRPCLRFLERSGLSHVAEHRFVWDLATPYPKPDHVEIHEAIEVAS